MQFFAVMTTWPLMLSGGFWKPACGCQVTVSVIGYNDDNDIGAGTFPQLTSVNKRFFDLGDA